MKLSDKLIALRKEKGWSQEDFAEKLYVSRQAISRWENGTALPDAQNILQISKLFNVTADYLLNDDYVGDADAFSGETVSEGSYSPPTRKKRAPWYLIPGICLIVSLSISTIALAVGRVNKIHVHPALSLVKENEVSPTCTIEGSYDEVFYCNECGKEVFRKHVISAMPAHQFENEKCTVCGEEQIAKLSQ